ncbi:uncharacterized protein LOC115767482 isoform X1 [Drosophila novamexicana]|uniref:uncharacterized protein LOC115767482 isoform X1 n=1 Tax=Drosophila novamexicana TaxID=47314 RepID=UPI0011E5A88F|nr:uncharacterized protein LOC115767482 isoform X1 [Drosophila novamexicana]XP_030567647.1 uncharacterized protein LOC115767482 isoform X1 [Drosophila novamexicana]
MRARQPNGQEREQLRRQRSETRLILARCRARGFEYVVNPPVVPKVAFGTTMDREVMPVSGPFLNSFMRSNLPEGREQPSPIDYDCSKPIGFKYPSNAGFSALANKMPRLPIEPEKIVPPMGAYEATPWILRAGYTFDKYMVPEPKWVTPGASTYSTHNKYPYWKMETAFGTRRIIWPAVAVFCGPNNVAQCLVCHERPKGDYFHCFATDKDMCRKCMREEMSTIKHCSVSVVERYRKRQHIKQFVPARYCGFFHDHNGTTAATESISRKELRAKIRVENYLYRFASKVE